MSYIIAKNALSVLANTLKRLQAYFRLRCGNVRDARIGACARSRSLLIPFRCDAEGRVVMVRQRTATNKGTIMKKEAVRLKNEAEHVKFIIPPEPRIHFP